MSELLSLAIILILCLMKKLSSIRKKPIHHSTKPKRAQPKLSFILLMMNHTMWVVNFQNKKFGKIYIVHRVYFLYTKIFTKWKFQLMTSSQSNKIYIGKWFLYLNSWHSCDRGGLPYTPFIQYNGKYLWSYTTYSAINKVCFKAS